MSRLRPRRAGLLLAPLALVLPCCGSGADGGAAPAPEREATSPRPAGEDAPGAARAPELPDGAPLVVFLGDSITAGLRVEHEAAFPAVLQRRLAAAGHPFRLVDAGVSGETSAGGLRRLERLLAQQPDVLVLELGGNDGLRGQPVAEVEARLGEIVRRAQAAGARVLLLGVRLPPSLGSDYVREFEGLYGRIAAETGCGLVPFFLEGVGGVAARMQDDGLHPNRAGHERIAENLTGPLAELLGALEPR